MSCFLAEIFYKVYNFDDVIPFDKYIIFWWNPSMAECNKKEKEEKQKMIRMIFQTIWALKVKERQSVEERVHLICKILTCITY